MVIEEAKADGYSFAFVPRDEAYDDAGSLIGVNIYKIRGLSFKQALAQDTIAVRKHYGKDTELRRVDSVFSAGGVEIPTFYLATKTVYSDCDDCYFRRGAVMLIFELILPWARLSSSARTVSRCCTASRPASARWEDVGGEDDYVQLCFCVVFRPRLPTYCCMPSQQNPPIPPDRNVLDLGCGPSKVPGAWGVDIHPYPGVDQVLDFNAAPWNLPSDRFDSIFAHHIVEHVASIVAFMSELHRVARPGAVVHIVTPHFSSIDSWKDPTHVRHLASGWTSVFTESYLHEQVPPFEVISVEVTFGGSLFGSLSRVIIRLKGVEWWEKKLAFVLRARNLKTTLRVVK
jgi:SAM-dependent methyltransferase